MAKIIKCEVCGKEVLLRSNRRYCSKECKRIASNSFRRKAYAEWAAQRKPEYINCKDCHKRVLKVTNRQLCNVCAIKRDEVYHTAYEQRPEVKEHKAEKMRTWRQRHPERYREQIRRRDGARRERAFSHLGKVCKRCGYNEFLCSLDIHHIDERKHENDWQRLDFSDWDNLIILCRNCHHALHQKKWTL